MKKSNGTYNNSIFLPSSKAKIVLEALHFYRQIIGFGREAELKARNTDLYRQIDSTVEYIAERVTDG